MEKLRINLRTEKAILDFESGWLSLDLTEFNIDAIIKAKKTNDYTPITFMYDTMTKNLKLKMYVPEWLFEHFSFTLDFYSVLEQRNLKLNQILDN